MNYGILRPLMLAATLSCGYLCAYSQHDPAASRGIARYVENGRVSETRLYDSSYALVLGMSNYENPAWDKLEGPRFDVREVKSVLEGHGFEVETEMNLRGGPLAKRIREFVDKYGLEGKGRRLVIYFAGHGYTMQTEDGRDMGYLVPIDAPDPKTHPEDFKRTAVDMETIKGEVRRIQSLHAMFIFDSCFSGLMTRSTQGLPRRISRALESPSRHIITSGKSNEQVPDQSVFRAALVAGLRGDADLDRDGYITGTELFSHISNRVINAKDSSQTPQSGKYENPNWVGDMVFFLSPDGPGADIEKAWQEASSEKSVAAISRFLMRFPGSSYHQQAVALWVELDAAKPRDTEPLAPSNTALAKTVYRGAALTPAGYEFTTIQTDSAGVPNLRAAAASEAVEQDLGTVKLKLARIPRGTFSMGSLRKDDEKPVRKVSLPEFYMAIHEVTRRQWEAVSRMEQVSIRMPKLPSGTVADDLPMTNISWDQAMEFCARLSRATGMIYSLPSEAEWEYAARAGTNTLFAFGDKLSPEYVNFDGSKQSDDSYQGAARGKPVTVGSLGVANRFGIFDLHGNVAEWCEDGWANTYNGASTDGTARMGSARTKVVRGGSYRLTAASMCSTCRSSLDQDLRDDSLGFRVVLRTPVAPRTP